ncbi:phage tail protein [Coleofasciculus sp. E1-EBD-02]|uniref:phage tail protein n=1 Tax=Coleofasciculus sp. E1-EBD-02 TaxID=3068481 RepID=UPI0032F9199E
MADLQTPLAPSSFSIDLDGTGVLSLQSVKVPEYKPKLAGEAAVVGSGKDGKSERQINSAGFEEVVTFDLVCLSSPSPTSASVAMWKWFKACLPPTDGGEGKWADSKKTGSIFAYNNANDIVAQWDFKEAWPSKMSIAELDVNGKEYLKETWTIVCENCTRVGDE